MKLVVTTPTGPWTLKFTKFRFPLSLRFGAATTIGRTTRFLTAVCPDVKSLQHEYDHVVHTGTFRYVWSRLVGWLWGSTYWREEEIAANAAALREPELWMIAAAKLVRTKRPDVPVGTITNRV